MDILKRKLAPITDQAWEEIDDMAKETLKINLSARKFVDIIGPLGIEAAAVPTGRLGIYGGKKEEEVCYGIHSIQPITELRRTFTLDIWELDNAMRGAKDVDVDPVITAAKEIAFFEENAIYNGFKKGNITGLKEALEYDVIKLQDERKQILDSVSDGINNLVKSSVTGPYTLVVSPKIWKLLSDNSQGYPLEKHLKEMIDGDILYSPALDGAYLISKRGGDLELTLGIDYSIGYESHDNEKVKLFITVSFTFRILDPTVFTRFEIAK